MAQHGSLDSATGTGANLPLSRRALLKIGGWSLGAAALLLGAKGSQPAAAQGVQKRLVLDLNTRRDQQRVRGQWRVAPGLVPGEPNEGLVAGPLTSPARLADYDDSAWEICEDVGERRSAGLTFAWYRMTIELPAEVDGVSLAGSQVWFETIADNYGEVWIDGVIGQGVVGNNAPQRARITQSAVPGEHHVIACLAINGPLAAPGGAVFLRYTSLVFEWVA